MSPMFIFFYVGNELALTLVCSVSRGHPEPPCVDQEELAERAARAVHPGRECVSSLPPFLSKAERGKVV